MTHQIIFTPEALDQLAAIQRHISLASGPGVASGYVDRIIAHCEN